MLDGKDKSILKARKAMLCLCKRYFPGRDNRQIAPDVVTEVYKHIGGGDESVEELYLEWTAAAYVRDKLSELLEPIDYVYDKLVEFKYTERNQYEYNDMDNYIFFIPEVRISGEEHFGDMKLIESEKEDWQEILRVFAMISQTCRYLVVKSKTYYKGEYVDDTETLKIYRYWDQVPNPEDSWDRKEQEEYKKKGIKHAVANADWLVWNYSDSVPGNKDVKRPDLKWYKKHRFRTIYQDCRDEGFVTGSAWFDSKDRYVMSRWGEIKDALFELRNAVQEMKEEEQRARSHF